MDLLPSHLHKLFNETKEIYSKKVMPLPIITLHFVEESKYLADAKANPLNQILIQNGLIQDFEKEYPGFMVVYEHNKSPLMYALRGCYGVSVCYSLAKKWLKPFTTQQAYSYLRHGFAHEIAHIMEDVVRNDAAEIGVEIVPGLSKELDAESVADIVEDGKHYKYVEAKLWEHIYKRAQNQKGGHAGYGMDKNDQGTSTHKKTGQQGL